MPGPPQRRQGTGQLALPVGALLAGEDERVPETAPAERPRRRRARQGRGPGRQVHARRVPCLRRTHSKKSGIRRSTPTFLVAAARAPSSPASQEVAAHAGRPDGAGREREEERFGVDGVQEKGRREEGEGERGRAGGAGVVEVLGDAVDEVEREGRTDERDQDAPDRGPAQKRTSRTSRTTDTAGRTPWSPAPASRSPPWLSPSTRPHPSGPSSSGSPPAPGDPPRDRRREGRPRPGHRPHKQQTR